MTQVTIVDYGIGNLRSVQRAFAHVGASVELTSDIAKIAAAERLVLPGVGAFGHCMSELKARGLIQPLLDFAASGRPFLGICVGMQVMLSVGEEFGEHAGLGLIPGRVRAIPKTNASGKANILPSIGWMPLKASSSWNGTLLTHIGEQSPMYFVHSFAAEPEDASAKLAVYDFGGSQVTAAIGKGNLIGLQFHPEKSAAAGLTLIKEFSVL